MRESKVRDGPIGTMIDRSVTDRSKALKIKDVIQSLDTNNLIPKQNTTKTQIDGSSLAVNLGDPVADPAIKLSNDVRIEPDLQTDPILVVSNPVQQDIESYQKILEDLKKIVSQRDLTNQESKLLTEALRMVRKNKKPVHVSPICMTIKPPSGSESIQESIHLIHQATEPIIGSCQSLETAQQPSAVSKQTNDSKTTSPCVDIDVSGSSSESFKEDKPKAFVLYDPSPHIKTIDTMNQDRPTAYVMQDTDPYASLQTPYQHFPQDIQPLIPPGIQNIGGMGRMMPIGERDVYDQYMNALINNAHRLDKSVMVTQVITLLEEYVKSMFTDGYHRERISVQELLSLLFFGNDALTSICKKTRVDVRDVLAGLRSSQTVRAIFDVNLFERFLDKRFNQRNQVIDSERCSVSLPVESSLNPVTSRYDRKKGILVLKEMHMKVTRSQNLTARDLYDSDDDEEYLPHTSRLSAHKKLVGKQYNPSCSCIVCLNLCRIVDPQFKSLLKSKMTDNPFENILQFESLLFSTLETGMMKDLTKYQEHTIENTASAVAYIDRIKTACLRCSSDECFRYFSEYAKQKTNNPIPAKNGMKAIIVCEPKKELEVPVQRLVAEEESDEDVDDEMDVEHHRYLRIKSERAKDNFLDSLGRHRSNDSDGFGISTNMLAYIASVDRQFQNLLNTMTGMLEMSSEPSDQWCQVDVYPVIRKPGESCTDPSKFELVAKHNLFIKYFHGQMGKKLWNYLSDAGYVDTETKKQVLNSMYSTDGSVFQDNTHGFYKIQTMFHSQKKNLLSCFLNLKDVYGTINHNFIRFVMNQSNVPRPIYDYIDSFLSKLKIRVAIENTMTDYFVMGRGVLRGDDLCDVIIMMCMGYIINIMNDKFKHKIPSGISTMASYFMGNVLCYSTDPRVVKGVTEELIRINKLIDTGIEIDFSRSYILMTGSGLADQVKTGIVIKTDEVTQTKRLLRLLKDNEAIRYMNVYELTSKYDQQFIDKINKNLINDFYTADSEMKKRGVLDSLQKSKFSSDKSETIDCRSNGDKNDVDRCCDRVHRDRDNQYYRHLDNTDIIYRNNCCPQDDFDHEPRSMYSESNRTTQKIYDSLMMKIERMIAKLIMPVDKMTGLVAKLDTVSKHYAVKWGVRYRSSKDTRFGDLSVKNIIQIVTNEHDPKFKKAVGSAVSELYKTTYITFDTDISYTNRTVCPDSIIVR